MPPAIPGNYIGLNGMEYMPPMDHREPTEGGTSPKQQVIDGTPARVAAIGIAAVAILVGLRYSGLRFNVAVGN